VGQAPYCLIIIIFIIIQYYCKYLLFYIIIQYYYCTHTLFYIIINIIYLLLSLLYIIIYILYILCDLRDVFFFHVRHCIILWRPLLAHLSGLPGEPGGGAGFPAEAHHVVRAAVAAGGGLFVSWSSRLL